ncbi:unnamed protein product, partial [Polarella glacialis]
MGQGCASGAAQCFEFLGSASSSSKGRPGPIRDRLPSSPSSSVAAAAPLSTRHSQLSSGGGAGIWRPPAAKLEAVPQQRVDVNGSTPDTASCVAVLPLHQDAANKHVPVVDAPAVGGPAVLQPTSEALDQKNGGGDTFLAGEKVQQQSAVAAEIDDADETFGSWRSAGEDAATSGVAKVEDAQNGAEPEATSQCEIDLSRLCAAFGSLERSKQQPDQNKRSGHQHQQQHVEQVLAARSPQGGRESFAPT